MSRRPKPSCEAGTQLPLEFITQDVSSANTRGQPHRAGPAALRLPRRPGLAPSALDTKPVNSHAACVAKPSRSAAAPSTDLQLERSTRFCCARSPASQPHRIFRLRITLSPRTSFEVFGPARTSILSQRSPQPVPVHSHLFRRTSDLLPIPSHPTRSCCSCQRRRSIDMSRTVP